ncbi:DNA-3-methyladenine glycosylase family protein [Pseudophaeobacter sp. TrK17]|uniref:DNA-3-methyladenine glycosylase family protein n=1 Tax=Pseudophaeobacter sp. TrK17 TaxID=2815167 RepID=UPI0035CFAC3F
MTPFVTSCAPAAGRIIIKEACVDEGAAWLAEQDPRFAMALAQCGPLPLRRKPDGFGQLLSAIVSQQVSVASANAIWQRLIAARLTTQAENLAATEDDLRAAGLSRQKVRYACALAQEDIDFDALRDMPTDRVIKALTQVTGVGVWTAEIYAMFSLGRADVFAPGDLALQEAAKALFDLPDRPKERELRQLAEAWSPWRSVAARILWAYYHIAKDREGIR